MHDILTSIANSTDLFPHLRTKIRFVCEECPISFVRRATHEFKRTDGEPDEVGSTYLCQDCTDNNHALGLLYDYDDLGNPNK